MAKSDLARLQVILEAESSRLTKELDKVNNRMGRWERRTKRSVTSVKDAFIGLGTVIAGAKTLGAVTSVAVEFERLKATLEGVTGSTKGAQAALSFIRDFAANTPFQVRDLTETFIKLKSFGLAPTYDVMAALTDQASKLGGSQEKLNGIVLAVGQAWAKQKLQGEEILQLVERGVPVWELLTRATGKTATELQSMSEKGELGRETIKALIDEMGKASFGASAKQVNTLGGAFSNFADTMDTVIDKLANEETGFSRVLADMTNAAAAFIRQANGIRTVADIQAEIDAWNVRLLKNQTLINNAWTTGSLVIPEWTKQAKFATAQIKALTAEMKALQAVQKKNEAELAKATGVVDTSGGGESAAQKRARENAEKALQREKDQALQSFNNLELNLADRETAETIYWWRRQKIIDNAYRLEQITKDRYDEITEKNEKKHMAALAKIQKESLSREQTLWRQGWMSKAEVVGGVLSNVSQLMQSENEKQFKIGKQAAIAQTVLNTAQMAVSAFNAMVGIPYVGPVLAGAAAAAAVAFGYQQLQAIKATTFQGGGSASVGTFSANPSTGLPTGTPGGELPTDYRDSYDTSNTEPLVININTHDATGFERLLRDNRSTIVQVVRDAQSARGQRATV